MVTTLIHASEIANILEARLPISEVSDILSSLLSLENIKVVEPSRRTYEEALERARIESIGVNDALAWVEMEATSISEIHSFDADFDRLKGIRRITE